MLCAIGHYLYCRGCNTNDCLHLHLHLHLNLHLHSACKICDSETISDNFSIIMILQKNVLCLDVDGQSDGMFIYVH